MKPLLIPSKNRADSKLFNLLAKDNINFKIVIEPQDENNYRNKGWDKNLLLLPENNRGLVYSRNFILNYARKNNIEWLWMCDDDVKGFYQTINNKNQSISPLTAFNLAEEKFISRKNIAQCSMEYQQYAWSQKKDIITNSYCDVVVCININNTIGINYRQQVILKEDRDFTLQCLSLGYDVIRTGKISFGCPKNGSNKGGLYDVYRTGLEKDSVNNMCKLWGDKLCIPNTKKDGRYDVKINWKLFAKNDKK